jgi:hypothetical protein
MRQRSRRDPDHPCLACFASWEIVEEAVEVAEPGVPITWVPVGGNCSARCAETGRSTVDQFNAALDRRRALDW